MSRVQQASDRAAAFIIAQEDREWSDTEQSDFQAWLAEEDGNKAAYWRLKHSWRDADRIGALGRSSDSIAEEAEVTTPASRLWKQVAIAASLMLMVGAGSGIYLFNSHYDSRAVQISDAAPATAAKFATAIGGHRVIPLDDGSKVELNTASAIRTSINEDGREVWLEKGEAYFEVAHLSGRPFIVHAGSRTVTVLGTKFSVRRDEDKITVSVVEGRVRVADSRDASPATVITGGDMVIARGPAMLFTAKSDERVEKSLTWRSGVLSFDQSPLSEVAAEFNRYNHKPIIIKDREAAEIRVGGVFPSSNPAAFVRLLRDAYGLHVETREDAVVISD
ncbi:FecR domain-containing protein [soil metagenome]